MEEVLAIVGDLPQQAVEVAKTYTQLQKTSPRDEGWMQAARDYAEAMLELVLMCGRLDALTAKGEKEGVKDEGKAKPGVVPKRS